MASTDQDAKSTSAILNIPDPPVSDPHAGHLCVPSELEARHYLYGIPSKPRLIARSSSEVREKPTGPEAYLVPKELSPFGTHRLNEIWEDIVGPAMDNYLLEKQVKCTSLHPLRIGIAGQPSPPAVIMIGVNHGTLSSELGIEVAVYCRSILLQNNIHDIHVIICESKFTRSAVMYGPTKSANPAAIVREPFSTTLGIPICDAMTTNLEGTGGFFFTDTAKPGTLYFLTSRQVLFHPDKGQNKLYMFPEGSRETRRQVMLMGEAAFNARCKAIESAIHGKHIIIDWLNSRLEAADRLEDQDDAEAERKDVKPKMQEAFEVIVSFTKLLADITKDRKDEKNCVIGHVTLSPPISDNYGDDGFTGDWAVIQIHPSMISGLNLIGNAIDLGSVEDNEVIAWMNSNPGVDAVKMVGSHLNKADFSPTLLL